MKGQYITLENVLFFAIGISMVILLYNSFSNISENIKKESYDEGLKKVGKYIHGNIIKIYEAGKQTNSNISITLRVPERVSDCIYKILVENGKMKLICTLTGESIKLNLYGINTKIKSEYIYSTKKAIKVKYKEGLIEIV
jgi:hypothetical protein